MQRTLLVALLATTLGGCGQAEMFDNLASDGNASGAVNPSLGPSLGPDAAGDTLLQLSWQPNTDAIAGYRVYYGPSGDQATVQASNLPLTANGFNPQSPNVAYNARRDLGLQPGSPVCFRLRAYNSQQGLSPWSAPACTTI